MKDIPDWEKAGVVLHGWNSRNVTKLQNVFNSKYDEFVGSEEIDEEWLIFLNGQDCSVILSEEIVENFAHLVNFDSRLKDSVCIEDPHAADAGISSFILVPNELAEKAIVLGALP